MIAFVILHYKNLKDTIECIESIEKLPEKKQIIVVDNNTANEKEQNILLKYTKDLILLDRNLGFAKANNIGCKYAIEKYSPDFLCVINNDTIVEQEDFISKIYELYYKYQFDMLGPKILPEYSESCNPFPCYKTLEEVESRIKYTKRLSKIYQNQLLRGILKIYIKTKSIFKKKTPRSYNGKIDELDIALHGCALVFSKKYYEKYKDIFYNETFLYHEEEFLYQRCVRDHLISVYSPSISIIHKEGQALNMKFNNKYDSLIFRNKEILKSLELLEKVMKRNEE